MRSRFMPAALAGLALAIFALDTVTNREIAVAVFHVMVVLLSVRVFERRGVVLVAAGCAALTVLSYVLTGSGSHEAGLVNCVISLSAIAATTYLALRTAAANAAAQDARAQLAHSARVTALGELTASIAHEVNQPLTGVVTSANACERWLSMDVPNLARASQSVQRIIDDANRASEIIARVRRLATHAPPREEWVDVNEMIRDILALTRHDLEESGIEITTDFGDELPRVRLDRVQVQQVLLNLVLNAVEAMKANNGNARHLQLRSERSGDGGVAVSVRDTGPGLTHEDVDRIFDAFYTTKPGGMGIGLTISRSIIEAHGGRVWATANGTRGATVQFTLPAGRTGS